MGMGGMSNKEQGPCTQSERSSRRSRKREREREREREGIKEGKRRSRILLHCMDRLLEQGGACRGRDAGDSYQCVLWERATQSVTEQSLCMC